MGTGEGPASDRSDEPAGGIATSEAGAAGGMPPARPRPPRWSDPDLQRRVARLTLVGLLVTTLIGGGLLAVGLFQVRAALETARGDLGEVRAAIGDVEVERAAAAIDAAAGELDRARSWTESPLWSVATRLPVAGRSIDIIRDVVEVGSAAVDIAVLAVGDGERLLGDGLDLGLDDGRIDLTPLLAARELMTALPVERLEVARDELAAPRRGWIPREVLDGRAETLGLADEALAVANRARSLTTALPGFLGAEGERRYFVGVQTSAELRGTGGLIGYFGILGVEDGAVTFGRSEALEASLTDDVERSGGDGGDAAVPATAYYGSLDGGQDLPSVDADPAFEARYGGVGATSDFANVNVDPDLPTTARVVLDLFELRTGQRLDGVILLDPVGVERLLEVTGADLPLDAEVAASLGHAGGVPTDRFAELTTVEVYDRLGREHSEQRRLTLRALGDAAFAQVVGGGWSSVEMVRAVSEAGAARHLQVFSEHPAEQQAFTDIGVAGALPSSSDVDAMVVVANNAVGGKQDVHLGHGFELRVELGDVRRATDGRLHASRSAVLRVTVDNALPASGMDEYIIGNCIRPEAPNACFEGDPGWNWTWFSAFLPAGTRLLDARTDDVSQPVSEYGAYRGFHVLDQFQGTPPRSRGSFEVDIEGRVPLQPSGDTVVYELLWWRQAKATPDLIDIEVAPPNGWRIVELEVHGGGDGRGSGVHGAGVELDAEVVDDVARLRGTVTADTRLRIHLAE